MSNFSNIPISHYKVLTLPNKLEPNAVYYKLDKNSNIVEGYITSKTGEAIPLFNVINQGGGNGGNVQSVTGTGVTGTPENPTINISHFISSQLGNLVHISGEDGKIAVNKITSPDSSIEIDYTPTDIEIKLSDSIASIISGAIQPGDNISSLVNDVGYITAADIPSTKSEFNSQLVDGDFLFVGDVTNTPDATTTIKGKVKLAGDLAGTADSPTVPALANKANIAGQVFTGNISAPNLSGTNTGDETLSSLQAKRPLKTIEGQSVEGVGNIDLNKGNVGLFNVDNTSDLDKPVSNATQTALNQKEDKFLKGLPNGYASLDSAGKVPITQLPTSIMEYKGAYNAATNSPTLTDGAGDTGDTYRVSVAGAGVNGLNFVVGDYVIYNGTIWEKVHSGADNVNSVFGRTGAVTSQTGDYTTVQITEVSDKYFQSAQQKLFNDATSSIQTQLNNLSVQGNTSLLGTWQYNPSTTPPPSFAQVLTNSATPITATQLYFHDTDRRGQAFNGALRLIKQGSRILAQSNSDNEAFVVYDVIGDSVHTGNYTTIPVSYSSSGTNAATGWSEISVLFTAALRTLHADSHYDGGADEIQGELLSVNASLPLVGYIPTANTLGGHLTGIDAGIDRQTELSAGAWSGFGFTNNGNGTFNIASGVAYLKAADDPYSKTYRYNIAGLNNIAISDQTNTFVLVDYNGGSPTITLETNTANINGRTKAIIYYVVRIGTVMHWINLIGQIVDPNAKLRSRFLNQEGTRRATGAILGFTNRDIAASAAIMYSGLIRLDTPAFNTATGSTFTQVYYNGTSWVRTAGNTQINNTQYVNGGVLTNMTGAAYRVDYIYILPNTPAVLYVVLGTSEQNLSSSRLLGVPSSLPPELQVAAVLIGRVIIQRNAAAITESSSAFDTVFSLGGVPVHNELSGLNTGDYIHLTAAEYANHGLNTAARHNPVTLGTPNGLSLSTQQLSLGLASSGVTGALSGTDWNTFNGKQNALTNPVTGTGTNNFLTKWTGANTVNASGAWRETSNRLANAADNGSSDFQVTGQIDLKSKNTQGDGGQLGAELLTTGTGDASWTGTSFATGYTHSTGSVTTLTSTLAPVINNLYQVAYTVTGRTAGSFTIAFGGATTAGITSSSAVGHRASTTGTLVITPTSDFNGTIVLSIKQITSGTASFVFRDNGGTIRSELRILGFNNTANGTSSLQNNTTGGNNTANGTSSLQNNTTGSNNTASGVYALQNNTTGGNNTASGISALQYNTTGTYNTANGVYALPNNTTGTYNTANGVGALQNNTTGGNNTASGANALPNNTTGSNNTASGVYAGRLIANGITSLTVANNSTFLGANTKALADNSTNETVVGYNAIGDGNNTVSIGSTSVVSSRLRGRFLQGDVVDNLIDSGQFSGNVLATGFKTASGTASQFLKADGSVDSNTYLTSASLPTVDQTIIDGSTNAVSGNAVFDGLSGKADDNAVVKLTGYQSITGQKTFTNSSSGHGIYSNNTYTGIGIYSNNTSTGHGIYSDNTSTGHGIVSNQTVTGTGLNFLGQNNGVNTFTVNKFGATTATSFIKSGGTSSQFLKADGSVDSNSYALASSAHNPITLGTANGLSLSTQQLSLGLASSGVTGALSGSDWNIFNSKSPATGGSGYIQNQSSSAQSANMWINGVGKFSQITLDTNKIEEYSSNSDTGEIAINYRGYLGGTTRFRNFNVYNGKNSPILQIVGSTGAATFASTVTASNGTLIGGTLTSGYIPKATGANALGNSLVYDNGTNIGIGTSSPSEALHVNGNLLVQLSNSYNTRNVAQIKQLGNSGLSGAINWALRGVYQYDTGVFGNAEGGDLDLIKSWNGNTILATKTDGSPLGNVGIGTTAPSGKFEIDASGSFNWGFPSTAVAKIGTKGTGGSLLVSTPSLNSSYESGFAVDGTYSGGKSVINLTAFGVYSGGPYSSDIAFRTTEQTTLSEKMRITGEGNLIHGDNLYTKNYISTGLAGATTWVKLCSVPNISKTKFNVRVHSNTSEESTEFTILTMYYTEQSTIQVNKNTYYNKFTEIRVCSSSQGGYKDVYVKLEGFDSNVDIVWSLVDSEASTIIVNSVTSAPTETYQAVLTLSANQGTYQNSNAYFLANAAIGTTNTSAKLHLNGALGGVVGQGGSTLRITNSTTGNYIGMSAGIVGVANSGLEFSVNGTSKAVISDSGNFGIGTNTPVGKFQTRFNTDNNFGLFSNGSSRVLVSSFNDAANSNNGIDFNASDYNFLVHNAARLSLSNTLFSLNGINQSFLGNQCYIDWNNGDSRIGSINNGSSRELYFGTYDTSNGYQERLRVNTTANTNQLSMVLGSSIQARKAVPQLALGSNIVGDYYNATYATSNPASQLVLDGFGGTINLSTSVAGTAGNPIVSESRLFIKNNGNVGIGQTNPSEKLHVSGNGLFTGSVTANTFYSTSDIRLKELVDYSFNVNDIKPISYRWKDTTKDQKIHVGYSAQEVEKSLPHAVSTDKDGIKSVDYIQVLVAKIEMLEQEVKLLKSKI